MKRVWKEPGLFNTYDSASIEDDQVEVRLNDDDTVEFNFPEGGYYGDDVHRDISVENLEKLVRVARALREYYQ